MTSSLHTKERDSLNLFTARHDTYSSIGSASTAHLHRSATAQTLRFQAFRHTERAARGHSTASGVCPMFTYLVHSIALFFAAFQSHCPKVDVRKKYVEKKRNSFLQRSRDSRRLWRVSKERSDLRNAHSKSQQFTAAHSTEFKNAVIAFASRRAIQEPSVRNFILKHSHSTVRACCNFLWNLLGSDHSLVTPHTL